MRTSYLSTLLLVFAISTPAFSEISTSEDLASGRESSPVPMAEDARDLIGEKVYDLSGKKLGTVRDVVLDLNSGRTTYVLVETGGIFRKTIKPVPLEAIDLQQIPRKQVNVLNQTAGIRRVAMSGLVRGWHVIPEHPALPDRIVSETTLAVNVSRGQFQSAPNLDGSNLAALYEPGKSAEIASFFGTTATAPGSATAIAAVDPVTGEELTPTGRIEPQVQQYKRSGDLIGKDLYNRQNERLGKITDLFIDIEGTGRSYAIATISNLIQLEPRPYLINLSALSPGIRNDRVLIDATMKHFEQAPRYDEREAVQTDRSTVQILKL